MDVVLILRHDENNEEEVREVGGKWMVGMDLKKNRKIGSKYEEKH